MGSKDRVKFFNYYFEGISRNRDLSDFGRKHEKMVIFSKAYLGPMWKYT